MLLLLSAGHKFCINFTQSSGLKKELSSMVAGLC